MEKINAYTCRLLEYICKKDGGPSSVCDFNVVSSETNPRAFKTNHTQKLLSPYPLTVGLLKVCTTTNFRKAHRNVDPSDLQCSESHLQRFLVPDIEGKTASSS